MLLRWLLGPRQVHPRQKAIDKQTKRVLVHVELLSLGPRLLVVLDIVEIDALDPVAEVILVDVRVARETEGDRDRLGLLQAEPFQMLLIVKLLIHFVQHHPEGSLHPQHHLVTLPENL